MSSKTRRYGGGMGRAKTIIGHNHALHRSGLAATSSHDPGRTRRTPTGATVKASCWCQRHYVTISTAHVAAGRTASCGNPKCKNPVETP